MEWDDSCDLNLLGIETTDQCTQTSGISEEQKAILQMHINYHDEMKTFLENFLYKMEAEGPLIASVYFKYEKPKKPTSSLPNLFEEYGQRRNESVEETHEFLKSKLSSLSLSMLTALDLSDTESWKAIALRIESFAMSCEQNHSSSLAADIKLGFLLEAGCKLFQNEKILGRIDGTFDDWMTKTIKISSRHARKLRAVARVFSPFPRLCKLSLPTTEVYNRLSQIRKILEVPEYQSYWQQVV